MSASEPGGTPQLRPMSIGELLDASFKVVRRRFGALVACVILIAIPVSLLDTLIQTSTTDHAFDFSRPTTYENTGTFIAGRLSSLVLSVVAFSLATAACLRAIGGEIVGSPVGPGESLRYAASRLGRLLAVALLTLLAVAVGLLLCILPGIFLGIALSLATPAVLFEDARGVKALRRSADLVKGNWWRVFGALVLMYLLVAVIQWLLGFVVGALLIAESDNEMLNAILVTSVQVLTLVIGLPLYAAVAALIYFDLRVRKEGFDLQLMAQRITGGPAPGATAAAPQPRSEAGFLPPEPPASTPRPPASPPPPPANA